MYVMIVVNKNKLSISVALVSVNLVGGVREGYMPRLIILSKYSFKYILPFTLSKSVKMLFISGVDCQPVQP